jgi:hypothetical protein
VFEAVRNEFGPEVPLLHDGHHRMTPIQAAQLGKSLAPYDLFWLEDCTPEASPGLGADLDLDESGKYPYVQADLPYNRLADGTVHDW